MRGSDVSLAFVVKFGAGYKTGRNINVGYIKLKKYIKENWNNFYGRINANTLQQGATTITKGMTDLIWH